MVRQSMSIMIVTAKTILIASMSLVMYAMTSPAVWSWKYD